MMIHPIQNINFSNSNLNKNKKSSETNVAKNIGYIAGGLLCAFMGAKIISAYNKSHMLSSIKKLKTEFINMCQNASEQNYIASKENIKTGTFNMDLHSHSNHSDGWGVVENILNEAAEYANHVFKKTGKKFTFALTDHDRVSGVKEALKIINSNPEKYKNLNFIPGIEFSFLFNSGGKIKAGEMLAYFINPDSKEIDILVNKINQNRLEMFDEGIKKLGKGFARAEMEDYFINKDGETFAYNMHYRLSNYAQIKNRINKIAQEKNTNPEELYKKLMDEYVFGNGQRVDKPYVSPNGFDNFLKNKNFQTQTSMLDENITRICDEFFPKIIDGKIVCKTENSFEKIIDTFKDDDDVIFAFAHPYFTAKQMSNYKEEFEKLLKYANGKIIMSENYHQDYNHNIPKEQIEEINKFLYSKKLIPIGGRDNHKAHFIEKNLY